MLSPAARYAVTAQVLARGLGGTSAVVRSPGIPLPALLVGQLHALRLWWCSKSIVDARADRT